MIKRFFTWLIGQSQVERLLLAATVVAALRMMLIHGVFIGFDLATWPWFAPVEVFSGLAFAVLEGKALAYVSRLWVGLRPRTWTEWIYWGVLALGQLLLLLSIVGVTAYAATSVRRETGIDDLLGDAGAVGWSMFVTALNPLMVMLIGIARAIDPQEIQQRMNIRSGLKWLSAEDEARLFVERWAGPPLTPVDLAREFERAAGVALTAEEAETYLNGKAKGKNTRRDGKG